MRTAAPIIAGPVIDLGLWMLVGIYGALSGCQFTQIEGPKVQTDARTGDYAVRRSTSASSRSPKG
jgi:hypothetical protein